MNGSPRSSGGIGDDGSRRLSRFAGVERSSEAVEPLRSSEAVEPVRSMGRRSSMSASGSVMPGAIDGEALGKRIEGRCESASAATRTVCSDVEREGCSGAGFATPFVSMRWLKARRSSSGERSGIVLGESRRGTEFICRKLRDHRAESLLERAVVLVRRHQTLLQRIVRVVRRVHRHVGRTGLVRQHLQSREDIMTT